MRDMFTVRRHLGRGKNFNDFQIRGHVTDAKQGAIVEHVNPDTHSIVFKDCRLHNKVKQSQKTLDGANKQPCAWLICESYEVIERVDFEGLEQIKFNPRKSAHWLRGDDKVCDNDEFNEVIMINGKIYKF